MQTYFYAIDLIIGLSLPVYIYFSNRSRTDGAAVIRLFWLGVGVGLLWEAPIFLSVIFSTEPVVYFLQAPAAHPIFFMVAHACWDGGIFLAGIVIIQLFCEPPIMTKFRWQELLLFILWGQVSALLVEIISILNQGWAYSANHPWNPVLFYLAEYPITLAPQLIWFIAPILYYLTIRYLAKNTKNKPSPTS